MSDLPENVKSASPPKPLRVLLVEDNPRDVKLTARTLERSGYRLDLGTADTPELFREQIKKVQPQIVISDYNLSGWTAIDALEILKELKLDTPVVIVSGSLGDEAAVECIKKGAVDFILKDRMARLPSAIERALMEKALRDEREEAAEALLRLKKAVDTSGEAVFMTDRAGIFTFVNPEFTRLYGYTAEEVVGKTTPRILKSDTRSHDEYASFWKTILENRVAKVEWTNKTRDGRLVEIEGSANPINDERGEIKGFLAIQRDITERRKLELQLVQAQKMEAVGRLAGGVAHDFNNLLTIINGYSELLLDSTKPEDPARERLAEIKKAGERAAALTRQLLAFSRRQVLAPKIIDLNSAVTDMDKMLRRLIGEDVDLVTSGSGSPVCVNADPGQIEQVIMNLAVNARDAMPDGGKLTIETSEVELDESYSQRHVQVMPGSYVMLAVTDTGSGMDKETQARIFEPFFTTKEKGKGTGLGLATVYGIVKQSGGFIWVYSELGQGTTFKVYLPRVTDESVPAAETKPRQEPERGSATILVVEDEESLRKLVRAVLEANGYTVLEAGRGDEALRICAEHKGTIDLLLTDVVMPEMNGRELAKRVASVRPGTRALFMSGYTDNAIVHHGVLDEGTPYIQKPFTPDVLARKITEVLSAES